MKPDPGTRNALPPALHTGTPGSFARRTIEQRKHSIIADLLAAGGHRALAPAAAAGLRSLDREIGGGRFSDPFAAGGGPLLLPAERHAWQQALRPLIGRPWLDLPWYEAEAAFYLRVLTATGYYERAAPGYGRDPFAHLKHAEWQRNGPRLAAELAARRAAGAAAFIVVGQPRRPVQLRNRARARRLGDRVRIGAAGRRRAAMRRTSW